jgi:hypothetical protein
MTTRHANRLQCRWHRGVRPATHGRDGGRARLPTMNNQLAGGRADD